jgi:hypothetical protein
MTQKSTTKVGVLRAAGVVAVVLAAAMCTAPTIAEQASAGPNAHTAPGGRLPILSVGLNSATLAVVSSTHHKLRVQVSATKDLESTGNDAVTVTLSTPHNSESHAWAFPFSAARMKVGVKGNGSISLPTSAMSPYGRLSLSFKATGAARTAKCHGVPALKTRHVVISGRLLFETHSTGKYRWGQVGSSHRAIHFGTTSTVVWTYDTSGTGCGGQQFPPDPCVYGLVWLVLHGSVEFSEISRKSAAAGEVGAERTVDLKRPKGAQRTDNTFGRTRPLLLTVADTGLTTLAVHADGGNATGSATLTSPEPAQVMTSGCGADSVQTRTTWPADYDHGSPRLRLSEQVFGALTMPDTSHAIILKLTKP